MRAGVEVGNACDIHSSWNELGWRPATFLGPGTTGWLAFPTPKLSLCQEMSKPHCATEWEETPGDSAVYPVTGALSVHPLRL